jgi:hypothetical protein
MVLLAFCAISTGTCGMVTQAPKDTGQYASIEECTKDAAALLLDTARQTKMIYSMTNAKRTAYETAVVCGTFEQVEEVRDLLTAQERPIASPVEKQEEGKNL